MIVKHRDSSHLEDTAEKGVCPVLLPEPQEAVDTDSRRSSDPPPVKRSVGRWHSRDRFGSYLQDTIPSEKLRVPLYLQAFSTGALDATTYADFRTFASNQTGNTILLTLAAFDTVPVSIAYTATSLGSFVVSSFVAGHLGHHVGARVRWWLLLSSFLQIVLLVIFIVVQTVLPTFIEGTHSWLLMMLLGSSAGLQVAMARHVGCPEIPTAMLSSPLVDFVTDPMLFRRWSDPEAASRNRRTLYVLSIISGSFCGSAIQRYQGTVATVLFATCVKTVMTIIMGIS